jgi:hypothetical protein
MAHQCVIEDVGESLRITVRRRRNWLGLVWGVFELLFANVLGWIVLGLILVGLAASILPETPLGWGWLWLPWLGLGGLSAYRWIQDHFRFLFHVEIVEVDQHAIRVRRTGFGLHRDKEYRADAVRGLRVPLAANPRWGWKRFWSYIFSSDGLILFAYRAEPFCAFGKGITPEEAQGILTKILEKFPHYNAWKPIGGS